MIRYGTLFAELFEDILDWITADKEERELLKYVPKYCQHCELLGVCRDEKKNWKCRRGCLILNEEKNKNRKL